MLFSTTSTRLKLLGALPLLLLLLWAIDNGFDGNDSADLFKVLLLLDGSRLDWEQELD